MGKITNWDYECPANDPMFGGAGAGGFDDGTGRKKRSVDFEQKNYNTTPKLTKLDDENIEYDIDEKLYNYDY